jgi:anthranilate 1,2-dioxygenase small subunit
MLADRVLSLRKANVYETQSYRHVIGMPRVLPAPAEQGRKVATSFVVMRINRQGHTDIFASGEYLDVVETHGDTLLLRARDVVCDSSRIDTLLALPL